MVYTGIGNDIEPAKIFTALSLFNLLRQPVSLCCEIDHSRPLTFSVDRSSCFCHERCQQLPMLVMLYIV